MKTLATLAGNPAHHSTIKRIRIVITMAIFLCSTTINLLILLLILKFMEATC